MSSQELVTTYATSWKYLTKRCTTLQSGLHHIAAPPIQAFRTLVSAHHLMLATLVHAELYAAPAIYVDKHDLLLVIYRTYILVFVVLPKPLHLSMRLLEYPRATSSATVKSQSEQKRSEVQDHRAQNYIRSRHDRTMFSSTVRLDALLVTSLEHCFSQYSAPSRTAALSRIEAGRSRLRNITGIYLHALPECRLLCCKSHCSFQITWSLATDTIVELGRVRSKPSTPRYTRRRTYSRSVRFCQRSSFDWRSVPFG